MESQRLEQALVTKVPVSDHDIVQLNVDHTHFATKRGALRLIGIECATCVTMRADGEAADRTLTISLIKGAFVSHKNIHTQ